MTESLIELKNMIGMETVKKSIVRQVLYFLQGIEEQQEIPARSTKSSGSAKERKERVARAVHEDAAGKAILR